MTGGRYPQIDIQEIHTVLSKQPDVIAVYLFGSTARQQSTHLSDIDIAVLLEKQPSEQDLVLRQLEIMESVNPSTNRQTQITVLNNASLFLIYQVLNEGILIYERSSQERISFVVQALGKYFDFKPRLDNIRQAAQNQIKEEGLGRKKRRPSRTLDAARRIHERLEGPSEY